VDAVKPTITVSAAGGNPSRMPTASVTTATPNAGNQPACMAESPTITSWMRAANAEYTTKPTRIGSGIAVDRPASTASSTAIAR
jgi:hypothetical protein